VPGEVETEVNVPVGSDADIIVARQQGRALAEKAGFSGSDLTLVATAISEVARNIVEHATRGEVVLRMIHQGDKRGISIVARDEGPGIADIPLAMQDGYSSGKGLGLGLPGARRLVDEFELESSVGVGTTVTMKKWLNSHRSVVKHRSATR
jgi:serine/threonine-protein kinase RsbT